MTEDNKDIRQFTLKEAAEQLGVHRVTLKRMEDRGEIPAALWERVPQPHRVYSFNEIEVIRKILIKKHERIGRIFVNEAQAAT